MWSSLIYDGPYPDRAGPPALGPSWVIDNPWSIILSVPANKCRPREKCLHDQRRQHTHVTQDKPHLRVYFVLLISSFPSRQDVLVGHQVIYSRRRIISWLISQDSVVPLKGEAYSRMDYGDGKRPGTSGEDYRSRKHMDTRWGITALSGLISDDAVFLGSEWSIDRSRSSRQVPSIWDFIDFLSIFCF